MTYSEKVASLGLVNGRRIICGDALTVLRELPDGIVHTCVTSPPYFNLRDYKIEGQMGLEESPEEYVQKMVEVFREVKRVLHDSATLWINIGDSYASNPESGGKQSLLMTGSEHKRTPKKGYVRPVGLKPKDLVGVPWRLAFALQAEGFYLRSDIIWQKLNPMPSSVLDRPTCSKEYIFLLAKSQKYFYDIDSIKEPATHETTKMPDGWDTGDGVHGSIHRNGREKGAKVNKQRGHGRQHAGFTDRWDAMTKAEQCSGMRNKRDVWTVATKPFKDSHFATVPAKFISSCCLSGSKPVGVCRECGAPPRQVYEKVEPLELVKASSKMSELPDEHGQKRIQQRVKAARNAGAEHDPPFAGKAAIGWESSCKCNVGTVPALVLDPFSGSGTTGLVANGRGRNYIGVELNPDYISMSERRLANPLLDYHE